MLSRALDEIIHAAATLPDHLAVASRAYDHSPRAQAAFRALRAALAAVDEAILGRQASPPCPRDDEPPRRSFHRADRR